VAVVGVLGADRICTKATPSASVVAPRAPTAAHSQRLDGVRVVSTGPAEEVKAFDMNRGFLYKETL
jgi:hypothetical protein